MEVLQARSENITGDFFLSLIYKTDVGFTLLKLKDL